MKITLSELRKYMLYLCDEANEADGYAEAFWNMLINNGELLKEFAYYAVHNDFLCEYRIEGITVADILVWQIDRFKAALDEGKFSLKYNPHHMVLAAFATMNEVADNPAPFLSSFRSETGTDYPGKTYLKD